MSCTFFLDWEDDDLVAQCAIFFFAGFETTSTLLCFMAIELACNPDAQQKLYEEIVAVEKKCDGKPVTYDMIKELKYMEMVINETLRLWPPVIVLPKLKMKSFFDWLEKNTLLQVFQTDRQVTKPYRLECNGRTVTLSTNDSVWIPIYGIHMVSSSSSIKSKSIILIATYVFDYLQWMQDEKYWSNPKQFDPDRFNDENRKTIQAGTYLPFGEFHGWSYV